MAEFDFADLAHDPLNEALDCIRRGWFVFPVVANGKRPAHTGWQRMATTDTDTVHTWFGPGGQFAGCNVGIKTGSDSNLMVLDVDTKRQDGYHSLNLLEHDHGKLPETYTVKTPSGGLHYYFTYTHGVRNSESKVRPGLDVRAEGGLVVASGSVVLSEAVYGRYAMTVNTARLTDAPPWLTELMLLASSRSGDAGTFDLNTDRFDWDRALTHGAVPDGEQQSTLYAAACSARAQGFNDSTARTFLRLVVAAFIDHNLAWPWEEKHADDMWERVKRERPPGRSLPDLSDGELRWVESVVGGSTGDVQRDEPAEPVVPAGLLVDEYRRLKARRIAAQRLDAEEVADARGDRPKRTAREFAAIPPPFAVVTDVLAAEANLLGGPSEAGKSLLSRDWGLHVAAGVAWRGYAVPAARNVLFVYSEGTYDFAERFTEQPLWNLAADRVFVLDEPVALTSAEDVAWLLREYDAERPGLVVFDVVYGMGMADDSGTKDVIPVMSALKRIAAQWGGATLALGHPGHNGDRRFRGSSMWRQLAAVEWHMADESLTCEKSKLADKRRLAASYRSEYPLIRWPEATEVVADEATRRVLIVADFAEHPRSSDSDRWRRLRDRLGVGERRARQLIREVREAQG